MGNQTLRGKPVSVMTYTLFFSLWIFHISLFASLVQINSAPRRTSMEAVLERSLRGRLDSVSLSWMRHGQQEQVIIGNF